MDLCGLIVNLIYLSQWLVGQRKHIHKHIPMLCLLVVVIWKRLSTYWGMIYFSTRAAVVWEYLKNIYIDLCLEATDRCGGWAYICWMLFLWITKHSKHIKVHCVRPATHKHKKSVTFDYSRVSVMAAVAQLQRAAFSCPSSAALHPITCWPDVAHEPAVVHHS